MLKPSFSAWSFFLCSVESFITLLFNLVNVNYFTLTCSRKIIFTQFFINIFLLYHHKDHWKSVAQLISCFVLQNALPSDDDDKDPNDPHKALDIDLDKWVLFYMCSTFITLTADFEDAEVIIFISKLVCQALKFKIFHPKLLFVLCTLF